MEQSIARELVQGLWWSGVEAVKGQAAVAKMLRSANTSAPDLVVSVGKAAEDMALGALDVFGPNIPTLVVTKYDHLTGVLPQAETIEAAHPVPDQASLEAGLRVLRVIQSAPSDAHILCLISGGASALAEHLNAGKSLDDLTALNECALADGLPIGETNAARRQISAIKGGQIFSQFTGRKITVVGLSDVEGDGFDTIGSGLFDASADPRATPMLAGSNAVARRAIAQAAKGQDLPIQTNSETLYCDVNKAADHIAQNLRNEGAGLYIWGGEPTVVLPPNPGLGGRNQALALAVVAMRIAGTDGITCLVGGTDGTDGPTTAAGGIVSGRTIAEAADAAAAMASASAYSYLKAQGALFETGPTGTNVMDIVVALKT